MLVEIVLQMFTDQYSPHLVVRAVVHDLTVRRTVQSVFVGERREWPPELKSTPTSTNTYMCVFMRG